MEYNITNGNDVFDKCLKRRNFFVGQCFHCGAEKHTQAFCPLAKCTICNKWGHNYRVCRKQIIHYKKP